MVANFIRSDDPGQTLVLPDRLMINKCFYQFRTLLMNAAKKGGGGMAAIMPQQQTPSKEDKEESGANAAEKDAEVQRLNMLVKQRDNEIGILLNYLNKQKEAQANGEAYNTGIPV